jgi:hypothetical protein
MGAVLTGKGQHITKRRCRQTCPRSHRHAQEATSINLHQHITFMTRCVRHTCKCAAACCSCAMIQRDTVKHVSAHLYSCRHTPRSKQRLHAHTFILARTAMPSIFSIAGRQSICNAVCAALKCGKSWVCHTDRPAAPAAAPAAAAAAALWFGWQIHS